MIKIENGERRYFDKNGNEITEGCEIRYPHGDKSLERVERVYKAEDGQLGTDATNPRWIETGRAAPCEYGIYPLMQEETEKVELSALSAERRKNGEVLRELAGDMVVCYEAGKPGMMRLQLEGCFGECEEYNRETLMLIPMDMASEDIDMLSDMWLTEQEKELGLSVGESCSSSSWWAGSKDCSHDNEITNKYDWLIHKCYHSEKLADGLLHMEFSSERAVRNWLEMNASECNSFEEFEEWLQQFFDEGNSIVVENVNGRENYDFDDCIDLFYGNQKKSTVVDLIAGAAVEAREVNQGKKIVEQEFVKE